MNENIAEKSVLMGLPCPTGRFAVAFCVACLITVEFLPVSLLTPMAQDPDPRGVAGQSVTVTAFVALFSQPVHYPDYSGDRQALYRYSVRRFADGFLSGWFSLPAAYAVSCWAAPVLGWRWADSMMSASLTMRLVPCAYVPKALSVILARFPSR